MAFIKLLKKYALGNSYFKNRQAGSPDTIIEIAQYFIDHGELPFEYHGKNWVYDTVIERQKRKGVNRSQYFTPDATAARMAEIANNFDSSGMALDACCGTGQISTALLTEGFTVTGFELDIDLVETCRKLYARNPEIQFIQSAFEDFPCSNAPLIVANPPYEVPTLTAFIVWLYESLCQHGYAVLLVPAGFVDKDRPKAIPEIMSKFTIEHRENMTECFVHTKITAEIIVLRKK